MRPLLLAALLLPAALAAPRAAAEGGEDLFTLSVNPLPKGTEGWERTSGGEKAFVWTKDDATLTFKVAGKDSPRVVHRAPHWPGFEARIQLRKGTKKLRLLLLPVPPSGPPGNPIFVDVPTTVASKSSWNDAVLRVIEGKASLCVPADAGEKEVASAKLPPGVRFRFGLEAPPGAEGALTALRLVRKYEDGPQVCEEGFESVFDGKEMGSWQPSGEGAAEAVRVENGFLVAEPRVQDFAGLVLGGHWYRAYELRFRALWATNRLEVRALEVPGEAGKINIFDSIHVNLTDHLDEENWNDVVVRLAEGSCTFTVNGKKVVDQKVKGEVSGTLISLYTAKGKRFFLRDVRVKDLEPGAGAPREPAPRKPEPGAKPEAEPPVGWTASGGFAEGAEGWEVAGAAAAGAGLLCKAPQASSYVLRFKVGKGARGLGVVPRANRGVERSPGVRLAEALFEKADWTEVEVEMALLTAVVRVGGAEVGRLESEDAVGAPALRVAGGGAARIRDLAFEPKRK